jgi:hypothetical protein
MSVQFLRFVIAKQRTQLATNHATDLATNLHQPTVVGHSAGDLKLPTSWVSHTVHFWRLTLPNVQVREKNKSDRSHPPLSLLVRTKCSQPS